MAQSSTPKTVTEYGIRNVDGHTFWQDDDGDLNLYLPSAGRQYLDPSHGLEAVFDRIERRGLGETLVSRTYTVEVVPEPPKPLPPVGTIVRAKAASTRHGDLGEGALVRVDYSWADDMPWEVIGSQASGGALFREAEVKVLEVLYTPAVSE